MEDAAAAPIDPLPLGPVERWMKRFGRVKLEITNLARCKDCRAEARADFDKRWDEFTRERTAFLLAWREFHGRDDLAGITVTNPEKMTMEQRAEMYQARARFDPVRESHRRRLGLPPERQSLLRAPR